MLRSDAGQVQFFFRGGDLIHGCTAPAQRERERERDGEVERWRKNLGQRRRWRKRMRDGDRHRDGRKRANSASGTLFSTLQQPPWLLAAARPSLCNSLLSEFHYSHDSVRRKLRRSKPGGRCVAFARRDTHRELHAQPVRRTHSGLLDGPGHPRGPDLT